MRVDDWAGKRYAIGLDIGDGESSLAWIDTAGDDEPEIAVRPLTGERSVLTATARRRDGSPVFGEQALMAGDAVQFTVNVKQPPTAGLRTPDSVLFAQLFLEEFFAGHPDLAGDCHVLVGHPAGWPAEAVEVYRRALAGWDVPVSLLPESQSALVHVHARNTAGRLDNVLVIDVGSSTTDFTVIRDLEPVNIPLGADVGCREIDMELAGDVRSALAGNPAFQAAVARPDAEMLLRLACRRAKEAQFSSSTFVLHDQRGALDPALAPIFDLAAGRLRGQDIKHLVARPGGWADRFRALLGEVRDRLSYPPGLIVLTGGGSRMDVVRRCCRAVFEESEIDLDREPSFSVARGLAEAGRHRARVARCHREMVALPEIPEVAEAIREHTRTIFEQVKTEILERLRGAKTEAWPAVMKSVPGVEAKAQNTEEFVNRIIRPYAEEVCVRYGLDVELGAVVKLSPPRMFTLEYVGRIVETSVPAPAGPDMGGLLNPNSARMAYKMIAGGVAAVRQHGMRNAVQQGLKVGGKFALVTAGVAALGFGAAWTTAVVIDKRERGRFLESVRSAELPEDVVAEIAAALSTEISRAVDESVAPLLKLVS